MYVEFMTWEFKIQWQFSLHYKINVQLPKGSGFISTSPPRVSKDLLWGAMRRDDTSLHLILPPFLPFETDSEVETKERYLTNIISKVSREYGLGTRAWEKS